MGRTEDSLLLDPLTGEVKKTLAMFRGNCTRATGSIDSIFTRGYRHGGSTRLAVDTARPERIALMRPDCHDGVIVAGGMLYWGPWMCDCSLSLVGLIGLGPAGDTEVHAAASEEQRLVTFPGATEPVASLVPSRGDWPCYRADNRRSPRSIQPLPTASKSPGNLIRPDQSRRPLRSPPPALWSPAAAMG